MLVIISPRDSNVLVPIFLMFMEIFVKFLFVLELGELCLGILYFNRDFLLSRLLDAQINLPKRALAQLLLEDEVPTENGFALH